MANVLRTVEPAFVFFTEEELASIPANLLTKDPTDHRARNFLLSRYPKVICRVATRIDDPDSVAPDGSKFSLLTYGKSGQIALATFPPKMISSTVLHHRVTEMWHCNKGKGIVALKDAQTVKKIHVVASTCFTIPPKTQFQVMNTGTIPWEFTIATSPLWESFEDFTAVPSALLDSSAAMIEISQSHEEKAEERMRKDIRDFFGASARPLPANEQTERIQMVYAELSPFTSTKKFRCSSVDLSLYVQSGEGKIFYQQDGEEEKVLEAAEGTAVTFAPTAKRCIRAYNERLVFLAIFQPKLVEGELKEVE